MTGYLPPGWPAGVHPPGSEEFEQTAVNWLLEVVPPDYRLHGVLMRHPVALASLARQHVRACVQGARDGYRTARADLGGHLPPQVIEAVLSVYRSEGTRLAAAAQGVDLIERAMRGEVFVPQLGGRQDASRRAAGRQDPGRQDASGRDGGRRAASGRDGGRLQSAGKPPRTGPRRAEQASQVPEGDREPGRRPARARPAAAPPRPALASGPLRRPVLSP